MDQLASIEQNVCFDLESGAGMIRSNEEGIPDFVTDDSAVKLDVNVNVNEGSPENNVERDVVGNPTGKEKRKITPSAKKPPRPPRGFSLDAYDQMLIKELTELAMIKRARIERMRALKQKKALKIASSSSSSSSHGTFFAMVFTIIFFLVILLQGPNSGATFRGSRQMETAQTTENGARFAQDILNLSAMGSISPNSRTSTLF